VNYVETAFINRNILAGWGKGGLFPSNPLGLFFFFESGKFLFPKLQITKPNMPSLPRVASRHSLTWFLSSVRKPIVLRSFVDDAGIDPELTGHSEPSELSVFVCVLSGVGDCR
jgi:hypothetical protein